MWRVLSEKMDKTEFDEELLNKNFSEFNEELKLNYIIVSRDEKVEKKCTLYPLRGRPDFDFRTIQNLGEFGLDSILLFPNGDPLTSTLVNEIKKQIELANSQQYKLNIILIDTRWKKTKGILDSLPKLRKVSLIGYMTGALRKEPPPQGGLASCEALYLTSLLFGNPDTTLLDNYHFRERFLKLNKLE
jgi:ribosome biogenesis protein Tsr3